MQLSLQAWSIIYVQHTNFVKKERRKGSKSAFWPHATISLSQLVWSIIRSWRFLLLSGFSGWAWYRKGFVHVFSLRVSIIISQQSGGQLDGWKAEILSLNFGNSWLTGEAVSLIFLFHHRHHRNHHTHLYHRHCVVHIFLARWCDWLGPLSTFRTCRREDAYCLLPAFTYHQDIVWLLKTS